MSDESGHEVRRIGDILADWLDQRRLLAKLQARDPVAAATSRLSRVVPSGFADLDKLLTGGLPRSTLICLAGRPGVGRTSLSLSIAAHVGVKLHGVVAIFTPSLPSYDAAERLIAIESGLDTSTLRAEELTDAQTLRLSNSIQRVQDAPIYIDDTENLSIHELVSKMHDFRQDLPVDLIILHDLELLSEQQTQGRAFAPDIHDVVVRLHVLARELDAPVLAIAQVSTESTSRPVKIPRLVDLPGSGALEEIANAVILLHREELFDRDTEKQGIADLHVVKNRNGPIGQVSLLFNVRTGRFVDLEVFRP